MDIKDTDYDTHLYLDAIWRRRYIFLLCVIIVPILSLFASYFLYQQYLASISLAINTNALPAMKDISTPIDTTERYQGLKAYILSPENLQKIAIDSRLISATDSTTEKNDMVEKLYKSLRINLLEKNVIEIQLIFNKPGYMVDILNLISQTLMRQFNAQETKITQASLDLLTNTLQKKKQVLKTSVEALSTFETSNRDFLPEYSTIYQGQLARIDNALVEKKGQYASLIAAKKELEQDLLKINPIITEIDRTLLANAMKLSKLRLVYTDNYSGIKAITHLDQALKLEREKNKKNFTVLDWNKILELWNMALSDPNGKANYGLLNAQLEKLITMKINLSGMDQEIAILSKQQNDITKKIQLITDNKQKLFEIKQAIKDNQTAYEDVLHRMNLAKMSAGLNKDERASLIKVVSYPQYPTHAQTKPFYFFLLVGLIAGVLLGICIPIVLELLDNTARNKRAIEAATGLPVICRVERLEPL